MKIWRSSQVKDGMDHNMRYYLNPHKAMDDIDAHGKVTWYQASDNWWRGAIEQEWGTEYYSVFQVHVIE